MNIHLILQMAGEAMGDREALVCGPMRMTYADLDHLVKVLANKVSTYDRLAYLDEAGPAFPVALFSAVVEILRLCCHSCWVRSLYYVVAI